MKSHQIRQLQADDLELALDLVWRVFLQFEAPEYSEEGIREFQDFIQIDTVRQKLARQQLTFWGCFDEERLLGILAMRPPCHISLLFVEASAQRQGIARQLFETMLDEWREHEHAEITVNSSPYAVGVYRKLGFIPTDSEQTVHGIRFTPMKRSFAAARQAPYVKLEVRLSPGQYRRAAHQYLRLSRTVRRWEAAVCWLVLLVAVVFTVLAGFKIFNLLLMLLSLGPLLLNGYLYRWLPRRAARHQPPQQFRLSQDGLEVRERERSAKLAWNQLRRHYQSKEFFFFEQQPRHYWVLPKSLLTAEQHKLLQQWLEQ